MGAVCSQYIGPSARSLPMCVPLTTPLQLTIYSLIGLVFCLLTLFNIWTNADIVRAANQTELSRAFFPLTNLGTRLILSPCSVYAGVCPRGDHLIARMGRHLAQQPSLSCRLYAPAVDHICFPGYSRLCQLQETHFQFGGQNQRAMVPFPRSHRPSSNSEPTALLWLFQPFCRGYRQPDVLRA